MQGTAIVTGASAGIGTHTLATLSKRGYAVVLACRDVGKGEGVAAELAGDIRIRRLDLADLESVRRFVNELDVGAIDVLINNAGVMGGPLGHTSDGFERQIGTNHLGHFAVTGLLLPRLLAASAPRVVTVTSIAARNSTLAVDSLDQQLLDPRPYEPMRVYANTKLANQLFVAELDRRAKAAHSTLVSVAAHPGISATGIFSTNMRNRGRRVLPFIVDTGQRIAFQSADRGAACSVRAATDPSVHGGEMVGPHGRRQSRGRPTVFSLYPAAQDEQLARALWELSERSTGVRYDALDG